MMGSLFQLVDFYHNIAEVLFRNDPCCGKADYYSTVEPQSAHFHSQLYNYELYIQFYIYLYFILI